MRRRRLVWHLFAAHLAVLLAVVLPLAWLASLALKDLQARAEAQRLVQAAELLAARGKQLPSLAADEAELSAAAGEIARTTHTRLTVVSAQGQVLADTRESAAVVDLDAQRPEIVAALRGETGRAERGSAGSRQPLLHVAVPLRDRQGKIVGAVRAMSDAAHAPPATSRPLWAGTLVALAFGGLLSYLASRRSVQPLEEIVVAARRLAQGEHQGRLPVPFAAETASLAESLNHLAWLLEERSHTIGRQGHEQAAVLASMVEGVLAVDSDQRVISLNRAAAELVGSSPSDLPGRSLQEVIRNVELRDFAARAVESDQPIESDIVLHGDRDRALRLRGTALRDALGRSVGAVIVMHDVTHFRHLENVRRDFVANVSHELKTPIASIKGFVETLLDGAMSSAEDTERFLRIVAKQADRLNSIIEDLLSLSKIEQSEEAGNLPLSEGRVRDVLQAVLHDCQSAADDRQIRVSVECDEALTAPINVALLEQAVINLLDNAIKYSEPGSEVRLSARQVGGEVAIAVADHGCGIEREHLPRLFERFYRVDKARSRKLGGTGLGLAIVKHIVQAHGGHISVTSTPGQGSTFTIHLPRAEQAASMAVGSSP